MAEFVNSEHSIMQDFDNPAIKSDDTNRSIEKFKIDLKDAFDPQNDFKPGQFYSFVYDYKDNPSFKFLPSSKSRYYDVNPVIYFYGWVKLGKGDSKYIEGLNFHMMTVESRMEWLDVVDRLSSGSIEGNKRIAIPPELIKKINMKNDAAVRIYNFDRISQCHKLDSSKLRPLMVDQARTFDAAGYGTVALRYETWQRKEHNDR